MEFGLIVRLHFRHLFPLKMLYKQTTRFRKFHLPSWRSFELQVVSFHKYNYLLFVLVARWIKVSLLLFFIRILRHFDVHDKLIIISDIMISDYRTFSCRFDISMTHTLVPFNFALIWYGGDSRIVLCLLLWK